jgi:RNA polymerase sigma-70 factor, ECF subfamily
VGSWLHTVARNLAISGYRRRARPGEVPLDENTLPLTEDGLDRMFDAWLVATALDSISSEQRAVIVALFYQRRSVAEVADLLAIPEGTVRSRCFYGLRALRKELEKQGITGP